MEVENEWEAIQPSTTSATQSDEDDGNTVVITTPTNSNDPSIFDPTNHEDLPVFPQTTSLHSYSSSSTSNSTDITEGELPQPPQVRITLLKASLGILRSWVSRVCYGIRSRFGLWSIAAFMTVTAYAWRRQWQRRLTEKDITDKMLLLIKQKDEKIKQLLLQIDRMNKSLSARRRVPVLFRIVVDSPLVLGSRSNWKPT